jgi:hypothetical protein
MSLIRDVGAFASPLDQPATMRNLTSSMSSRALARTPATLTLALCLPLLACGDKAETSDTESTGADSDSGAASDTVTGGDTGGEQSGVLVGTFRVELVSPQPATADTPATDGKTTVLGKIYDGVYPAQIIWEEGTKVGDCQLLTPRVPFCNTPCGGSAVCVEDDTCQDYPLSGSAGTVTVKGLKTEDGKSEFTMSPIANNYQAPASAKLLYPAFAEGDAISMTASGDRFAAFKLSSSGIAPLVITTKSFALAPDQALALTWTPAAEPTHSTLHVKLDISHHGGSKGMITCDTPDTGSLEIGAPLITELLALGAAGYPTIIVTRQAVGSATIAEGRIDLVLASSLEYAVTVPGVTSCTDDVDCSDGKTCQSDLTCQ